MKLKTIVALRLFSLFKNIWVSIVVVINYYTVKFYDRLNERASSILIMLKEVHCIKHTLIIFLRLKTIVEICEVLI